MYAPSGDIRCTNDAMQCDWVERHLSAYHDGALNNHTTDQVRQHLATCAACSAMLAEYARFDTLLKRNPRVSPAPALRARIFNSPEFRELVQDHQGTVTPFPTAATSANARHLSNMARWVTQVAAVLVILSGAGLLIGHIMARQPTGALYASCAHPLASGDRLVYQVGSTLYSGEDRLVCDPHARVGSVWQVSPDGHWVAYVNSTRGEVRMVRANDIGDHAVATGPGDIISVTWSPDSQAILLVKQTGLTAFALWLVPANQTTAMHIGDLDQAPAALQWAPDSQTFAYVTGSDNQAAITVRTATQHGAVSQIATPHVPLALGWVAGSTPRLTWVIPTADGKALLALSNFDGTTQTLTTDAATFAAVNAQGVWALATASGVTTVDMLTKKTSTVALTGAATALAWSPAGDHLAAANARGIWLVTATGATAIATDPGTYPLMWTPDGATLYFGSGSIMQEYALASGTAHVAALAGIPTAAPQWSSAQ